MYQAASPPVPRSFLSRTSNAASACSTRGKASLKSRMPWSIDSTKTMSTLDCWTSSYHEPPLFSPSLSSYCQRQTPNQQPLGLRRAWWVLFVCVSLRDALFLLLRHLLRNLSALDRFNIGFLSLSQRKCGTASPDCPRVTIWRCPKRLQLQFHSVQKNGPMSLQQGVAIFKILPFNVQQRSLLPQLSQTSFQLFWYATSFTFPSVHAIQKSLWIWDPPRCSHGLSLDQSPPRKCPLSRLSLWRRWPAKVTPKVHS